MDADGLPIIGTGIDFTKVEAIHQKRTLAFLNHFITHTARFMNRFSCVCEEKLSDLSVKIQRLETSMSILEAKLSSIPGLDNITVAARTENATASSSALTAATAPPPSVSNTSETSAPSQTNASNTAEETIPDEIPVQQTPTNTVAQDPAYAKFLKMLKLGVPVGAIKMKMQLEGLNPDLLDTPDAPAPSSSQNAQEDSDVDFSDDGDQSESDDDSTSDAFSD
ncbi:hypothetical protein CAPTEDRAFT_164855 [Capitella teleta]|uniref:WASH complex subunit 3 n=1 Tax=Capitella teleta TaxID=283909 RepID=R7V6W9_CAPTE|nr:hypothetical protein CAPTEDRAFT_164855 [Capitella teleta]|eukprot:ELU14314.1 hypothetical protein CAPTEDRAFT_164855 [Capitella teleta]